ncbi:MAG: LPS export ABC transporter periplasmic protein LptC [Bacillota bacterium]
MSKRKSKIIAVIIIFLAAVAFIFAFLPEEEREVEERQDDLPQQEMKDFHFTLFNDDRSVRWELTADEGQHKEDVLDLEPLSVRVLREKDEKQLYSLTARGGDYREQEEKLYIEGPVDITRDDYRFHTGDLVWDQSKDLITGREKVEITGSSLDVKGSGLEADSGFEWVTITGSEKKQANLRWGDRDEAD